MVKYFKCLKLNHSYLEKCQVEEQVGEDKAGVEGVGDNGGEGEAEVE